jgi:hypothetical protein
MSRIKPISLGIGAPYVADGNGAAYGNGPSARVPSGPTVGQGRYPRRTLPHRSRRVRLVSAHIAEIGNYLSGAASGSGPSALVPRPVLRPAWPLPAAQTSASPPRGFASAHGAALCRIRPQKPLKSLRRGDQLGLSSHTMPKKHRPLSRERVLQAALGTRRCPRLRSDLHERSAVGLATRWM